MCVCVDVSWGPQLPGIIPSMDSYYITMEKLVRAGQTPKAAELGARRRRGWGGRHEDAPSPKEHTLYSKSNMLFPKSGDRGWIS